MQPPMIVINNFQPDGSHSWILPGPYAGELSDSWGARILRFILDTRTVHPALDDQDLRLADVAAQRYAIQARGLDGRASRLEPHQLGILEAYRAARTLIQTTQARRRRTPQDGPQAHQPPQGGRQPGRPAPLNPPRPQGPSHSTAANAPAALAEAERPLRPQPLPPTPPAPPAIPGRRLEEW